MCAKIVQSLDEQVHDKGHLCKALHKKKGEKALVKVNRSNSFSLILLLNVLNAIKTNVCSTFSIMLFCSFSCMMFPETDNNNNNIIGVHVNILAVVVCPQCPKCGVFTLAFHDIRTTLILPMSRSQKP